MARSVIPRPTTCCERPKGTVSVAWTRPKRAPLAKATATPHQSGMPRYTAIQPAKAPKTMIPSIPRLRTPARSQMSSPIVAKMSGEAMRTAAAQKLAVKRISTSSIQPLATRNFVSWSPSTMKRSALASSMSAM